jgi:acylphosphatase
MPFRSEKQRRFLWAAHPDIAKRWAHEYPKPKKLPLYVSDKAQEDKKPESSDDDTNKKTAMVPNNWDFSAKSLAASIYSQICKKAESTTVKVTLPQSDKPMAAGEKPVQPAETVGENHICEKMPEKAENSLFKKLSVVLSQPIMQAIENERAEQEARNAQLQPMNSGIKRYAMPAAATPPPMGMAQAPAAPAAPAGGQASAQGQSGQLPPVGGGSSPNANPINSYGAISSSGDINGNASFGTANSSEKISSTPAWQRSEGKNEAGGLNEKGRKSYEREHGGNLKAPVTESNPKGDRAKRQNSFCSRMCGMRRVNTGASTAKDPDSRINKSLRKWNCKCSSAYEFGKQSAVYSFEGNVQGVNLRKSLHQILDELQHPGLAYNNARTGEARAIIPGNKKKQQEVLDRLRKHLAERTHKRQLEEGTHYKITPLSVPPERLHNVSLAPKDIENFVQTQGFMRLAKTDPEYKKQWLQERYRLQPDPSGAMVGKVPALAKKQLLHGEPVYEYQLQPGWPDEKEKSANLMEFGRRIGLKGISKAVGAARSAFRGPMTTLGDNVPQGVFQKEREQALQAGNEFLKSFQPKGFQVYAGRVKTPQSIAGHGDTMTNDLLGFRLTSQGGYDQPVIDSLTKQLTEAGVNISKSQMLQRPGYHGWNIKGTLGQTPVEFQLSPRRLQGLSAADHSMVYKPHESGVMPAVGKYVYKPMLQYGMTVASPMVPAGKRLAYGAGGAAAVGGAGAGVAAAS